jgi:hypothetical protein
MSAGASAILTGTIDATAHSVKKATVTAYALMPDGSEVKVFGPKVVDLPFTFPTGSGAIRLDPCARSVRVQVDDYVITKDEGGEAVTQGFCPTGDAWGLCESSFDAKEIVPEGAVTVTNAYGWLQAVTGGLSMPAQCADCDSCASGDSWPGDTSSVCGAHILRIWLPKCLEKSNREIMDYIRFDLTPPGAMPCLWDLEIEVGDWAVDSEGAQAMVTVRSQTNSGTEKEWDVTPGNTLSVINTNPTATSVFKWVSIEVRSSSGVRGFPVKMTYKRSRPGGCGGFEVFDAKLDTNRSYTTGYDPVLQVRRTGVYTPPLETFSLAGARGASADMAPAFDLTPAELATSSVGWVFCPCTSTFAFPATQYHADMKAREIAIAGLNCEWCSSDGNRLCGFSTGENVPDPHVPSRGMIPHRNLIGFATAFYDGTPACATEFGNLGQTGKVFDPDSTGAPDNPIVLTLGQFVSAKSWADANNSANMFAQSMLDCFYSNAATTVLCQKREELQRWANDADNTWCCDDEVFNCKLDDNKPRRITCDTIDYETPVSNSSLRGYVPMKTFRSYTSQWEANRMARQLAVSMTDCFNLSAGVIIRPDADKTMQEWAETGGNEMGDQFPGEDDTIGMPKHSARFPLCGCKNYKGGYKGGGTPFTGEHEQVEVENNSFQSYVGQIDANKLAMRLAVSMLHGDYVSDGLIGYCEDNDPTFPDQSQDAHPPREGNGYDEPVTHTYPKDPDKAGVKAGYKVYKDSMGSEQNQIDVEEGAFRSDESQYAADISALRLMNSLKNCWFVSPPVDYTCGAYSVDYPKDWQEQALAKISKEDSAEASTPVVITGAGEPWDGGRVKTFALSAGRCREIFDHITPGKDPQGWAIKDPGTQYLLDKGVFQSYTSYVDVVLQAVTFARAAAPCVYSHNVATLGCQFSSTFVDGDGSPISGQIPEFNYPLSIGKGEFESSLSSYDAVTNAFNALDQAWTGAVEGVPFCCDGSLGPLATAHFQSIKLAKNECEGITLDPGDAGPGKIKIGGKYGSAVMDSDLNVKINFEGGECAPSSSAGCGPSPGAFKKVAAAGKMLGSSAPGQPPPLIPDPNKPAGQGQLTEYGVEGNVGKSEWFLKVGPEGGVKVHLKAGDPSCIDSPSGVLSVIYADEKEAGITITVADAYNQDVGKQVLRNKWLIICGVSSLSLSTTTSSEA